MAQARYDLVVVGGGSGGLTASIMAARLGARVLLVDRESLGGDCLHYGCVPSKALIATAKLAHRMGRAEHYGLEPAEVRVDIGRVMARIAAIKATIAAGESPEHLAELGVEVAFGGARFVDAHTLRVGAERLVTAERVVIATGSRARAPAIEGLAEAGYLNHVSIFHLERLPSRLAVIGGGPIGCELGQAMARLGSEVTVVQRRDRLLVREEPDLSAALAEIFESEGIRVCTGASPVAVEIEGDDKVLILERGGERERLRCDEILVAVGRAPNVEDLDLEVAGVALGPRGIAVDESLRTSVGHIYAVGDCNGGPQFTHWAEHEARIATRNALFVGRAKRAPEVLPRVTFTDPEVASVGLTLVAAQQRDEQAHAHRVDMAKVDRAVCEGEAEGLLEVVVDRKDRVLGAHAIGAEAGELLGEWVLAMEHGIALADVGKAIHAYPTRARANRRVDDERFVEHGVSRWTTRLFGRFDPDAKK